MIEAKILGTIDVERDHVWCIGCDRKNDAPKKIYPGGRMSLVYHVDLNRYEAWCMECSMPLMEKILREAGVPIPKVKAPTTDSTKNQ